MSAVSKIGYIVSERNITKLSELLGQTRDESQVCSDVPVLIVGNNLAKQDSEYRTIIDKTLGENRFWTFSRSEMRSDFEKDLWKFEQFCIKRVCDRLEYRYIDLSRLSVTDIKRLINLVNDTTTTRYFFFSDGMVYFYDDGAVNGVSAQILRYCKIKPKKLVKWIDSNPTNIHVSERQKGIKELKETLGKKKYAIPYIFEICDVSVD